MEGLGTEEQPRPGGARDDDPFLRAELPRIDLVPARPDRLLVGDLVTTADERGPPVGRPHVVQAEDGDDGVRGRDRVGGGIAMELPVADAVADPRRLGAADQQTEAEFRALEEGLQHIQQWRVPEDFCEGRAEEGEVRDLAHARAALLRGEDAGVPLGVVPHVVALQEDLLPQVRLEVAELPGNPFHAFAEPGEQGGLKQLRDDDESVVLVSPATIVRSEFHTESPSPVAERPSSVAGPAGETMHLRRR
jgi:hypothetical protein